MSSREGGHAALDDGRTLRGDILEALARAVEDPEKSAQSWPMEGAPLGILNPIPCHRAFPRIATSHAAEDVANEAEAMFIVQEFCNNPYVATNQEDVECEMNK